MENKIHFGIRRLVLLNTESFSLGDFPLDRPLSISATNNVGKSTAINALQFPFLCNRRDMVFPKDDKETLKYYFPYENSYVLSEILTDTGMYVLGAAGRGQLAGYEYQLFAFKKNFTLSDFLVDDQEGENKKSVRTLKELERHLGLKDIWVKKLRPKQMQDALIGKEITLNGNEKFSIGLFRLKSLTDKNYRLFMSIFKNLLHMNNFNMEEVKMFLINALLPSWETVSGDFMTEYKDYNLSFEQERNKIRVAENISDEVEALAALKAEWDEIYQFLSTAYQNIEHRYQKERDQKKADIKTLTSEFGELENKIRKIEEENSRLGEESRILFKKKEDLNDWKKNLEKQAIQFKLFPSMEECRKQLLSLEKQRDQITIELGRSSVDSVKRLEQKIQASEKQINKLKSQLAHNKSNLLFLIKDHFNESDIQILMKLINNQIFTSFEVNGGDLNVHDEKALVNGLKTILSHCENGFYNDGRILINLAGLDSVNLDDYFNYEQILDNLDHALEDLHQLKSNLHIALNYQQREKERDAIDKKAKSQERELDQYGIFLENKKKESVFEQDYTHAVAAYDEIQEKIKNKDAEKIHLAQRRIGDQLKTQEKQKALLKMEKEFLQVSIVNDFEGNNAFGGEVDILDTEQIEIGDLINSYIRKKERIDEIRTLIEHGFLKIQTLGGNRFSLGSDIPAQILSLQEHTDKESIKNYKQALKNLQEDRSRELGAMLKNLANQLELFKVEINRFNNEMNQHPISNIQKIKFIVNEDNNILSTIKKLIFEDTLFGGSRHIDQVVENLNHIIKDRGISISLPNLFNLGIYLKLENGKEIENFGKGSIESTGTDLTVKVVLNVMLLSRILHIKPNQMLNIPAYIDEAGQIDPINQQTLIEQCAKAGFIPVFASVEAQSTAEYWIGLKEVDGKILVTKDDWYRLAPKPLENPEY